MQGRDLRRDKVERSGPSIQMKIILLVGVALAAQDVALLAMHLTAAPAAVVQAVVAGVLVLSIIVAGVWGNAVSRAIRQLARACYVARRGDSRVLFRLPRSDELGQLNDEINELVVLSRDLDETRSELEACAAVAHTVTAVTPGIIDASNELTVSLKELREGAAAEMAILRKISTHIKEAMSLSAVVARRQEGEAVEDDIAASLNSLAGLSSEIEMLADQVIDEVARPSIDEAALARAVNGLRDAARTMADVSNQASAPLEKRGRDAAAAAEAIDRLKDIEAGKGDGRRVAELMEKSAASGISAAGRLSASLRKLSVVVESHRRSKSAI